MKNTVLKKRKQRLNLDIFKEEAGWSEFHTTVTIVILIAIVLCAVNVGWTYWKHIKMRDAVYKVVNYDKENHIKPQDEDVIFEILMAKANNLGIPMKSKQINIEKLHDKCIHITIRYKLDVNFFIYKYTWDFKIDEKTTDEALEPFKPKRPPRNVNIF